MSKWSFRFAPAVMTLIVATMLACTAPTAQEIVEEPEQVVDRRPRPVFMETLVRSQHSGINDAGGIVVRDDSAWTMMWDEIHAYVRPQPDIVMPDFSQEVVVVVAAGQQPSAGYAIAVDSVARQGQDATVYLTKAAPGPDCMVVAVITNPVHAVRVPSIAGSVMFLERSVVVNCK